MTADRRNPGDDAPSLRLLVPEQDESAAAGCREVPLELSVGLYASGMNGALRRTLPVDAQSVPLLERIGLSLPWKPSRQRVKTFGLTFPEGAEFVPPKK